MDQYNVDFAVPLSGSKLFDLNQYLTAKKLCDKFPGLNYDYADDRKSIRIFGNLNEYWMTEFNKAVFEIGRLS